jgi:agmatinase
MKTFAGIEKSFAAYEAANVLLQSIPYDGTSTWGKGADKGFDAFIDASQNLELYDIETDTEVYRRGIHILPPITENSTPDAVFEKVYASSRELIKTPKFPTFFGGEHAVSIGIIKAFYEAYPDITIVHLDAHADLRESYRNSPYNHACALHDASRNTHLVQIGIRSMDISEKRYMQPGQCFFAIDIVGRRDWIADAVEKMHKKVYLTIDLDVFDPSIMPSTGTPEPGGLDWMTALELLKEIFTKKNVLGFDLVELAPRPERPDADFLAAKLYYKMLSYKFKFSES